MPHHSFRSAQASRRAVLMALLSAPFVGILDGCSRQPSALVIATTEATVAATPEPAASVAPTAIAATPTTAAASPTSTVAPATRTPTPPPTATVAPTTTPNAAATAQAINASFPSSGWDFHLRPLLFQIDNAPDAWPQNGLSSAYVVYETPAEGTITRLTALVVQQTLETIGNLRSARLVDLELVPQWNGLLVHVGASTPVEKMLQDGGIVGLDLDVPANYSFGWRTSNRIAPYNLYSSLSRVRSFAQSKRMPRTADDPRAFPTGPLPAGQAGSPGERVVIPYGEPSNVLYAWDAQAGGYRRFVNGVAQVDANTGHQIVAANVVVHFAVQTVTDIIEDVEGSRSLKFGLVGSGRALLFRDGRRIDLTWTRQRSDQVTRYEFGGGAVATFAPGSVWIALVADTLQVG